MPSVAVSPENRSFVVLLPETPRSQARRTVQRLAVRRPDAAPLVATFHDDASSFTDLLARVARPG